MRNRFAVPLALVGLSVLLGGGCEGENRSETGAGSVGTGTTAGSTSFGSTAAGTSSSGDPLSSSTAAGSSTGEAMPTTVDPTTGPPPPPKLCSLEAVDPLADPSIVEMGDEEGLLPTVIGEALLRNCGCHYSDNPDVVVDYIGNTVLINTWADFHVPFIGVFPMGFEDRTVWEATQVRVVEQMPLPMPAFECGVEGEEGVITQADRDLFEAWFEAGAPDGANFPVR